MHYSTLLLSALAATGTLAARHQARNADNSIRVGLENQAIELGSGTNFEEDQLAQTKMPTGSSGPFKTVALQLGPEVKNQALRCQILDKEGNPITVVRGANTDITFADGGKGEWTLRDGAQEVSHITCDPNFVQAAAKDTSIRVTLSDGNLATQTAFNRGGLKREVQNPSGSDGPYNSVNLDLGANVEKQDLRCQIVNHHGRAITLQRGANIDTTFGDVDKGPWSFLDPKNSKVAAIVCDPSFVKASA